MPCMIGLAAGIVILGYIAVKAVRDKGRPGRMVFNQEVKG